MSLAQAITNFEGIYEVSEAAHYLLIDLRHPDVRYRVRTRNLIRWIHSGLSHPSLIQIPGRQLLLTFEDLISMRVIAFLRAHNYSFHKIRRAEAVLREITKHPRPFATDDIWANKERSRDIFSEMTSTLLVVTKHGQIAFKELWQDNLISVHGLTFDQRGIVTTWTPRPGVLLHPQIQFGRPCIAGTRIPTADIAGMVAAGDDKDFLAESYGITTEQLEKALAWETELAST